VPRLRSQRQNALCQVRKLERFVEDLKREATCAETVVRDAAVRGEAGDQTDQESRSASPRAAPSMTAMDITIHASFLPHDDPEASLASYRDTLGFEVRDDLGYGGMRRITSAGSLASSVLATVRPLSSPQVKRLGLVRRTEVLRNG
jgi:hypothetical protein